jgi:Flp pilus assembly protein TadD
MTPAARTGPPAQWRSARRSLGSSDERSIVPWALTALLVIALLVGAIVVFRQVSGSRGSEATWRRLGDAQPYVDRALAARARGDRAAAKRDLSEAIQLVSTHPVALREMGTLLYEEADYDLARRFLVRAVRADPTDPIALNALGCALVRLDRAAEAERFFARTGGRAQACR